MSVLKRSLVKYPLESGHIFCFEFLIIDDNAPSVNGKDFSRDPNYKSMPIAYDDKLSVRI